MTFLVQKLYKSLIGVIADRKLVPLFYQLENLPPPPRNMTVRLDMPELPEWCVSPPYVAVMVSELGAGGV